MNVQQAQGTWSLKAPTKPGCYLVYTDQEQELLLVSLTGPDGDQICMAIAKRKQQGGAGFQVPANTDGWLWYSDPIPRPNFR